MAELHRAAFTTPAPWDAAAFASWIETSGVQVSTSAQGFCIVRLVADEAEILTFAIHPDAQGRGQGAALLREALERAQNAGATSIFLEVAETNAAARALYRRAGFAQAGQRPGYYRASDGSRINALILRAEFADITVG